MRGHAAHLDTLPRPVPGQPYRIAFVCTGNICRSPMAEIVTRSMADAATLSDGVALGQHLVVTSAGTGPWHEGEPMDRRTRAALLRGGYPDHPHIAHQVAKSGLAQSDLVVALDRRHQQTLRSLGADRARLFLLRSFDQASGAAADVPDPFYGDEAEFDTCLAIIAAGCGGLVAALAPFWEAEGVTPSP